MGGGGGGGGEGQQLDDGLVFGGPVARVGLSEQPPAETLEHLHRGCDAEQRTDRSDRMLE